MPPDEYAVTDNDVHAGYDKDTGANDLAMLTLARPGDYKLVRVVDDSEDDLWKPGTLARVLGWGEIEGGNTSNDLLTGDVSIFDHCDLHGRQRQLRSGGHGLRGRHRGESAGSLPERLRQPAARFGRACRRLLRRDLLDHRRAGHLRPRRRRAR